MSFRTRPVGAEPGLQPTGKRGTSIAFPFASEGGFAEDPLVMLGGEMRASRSLKIITENWSYRGKKRPWLSLGVRIIGSRTTVEAAGEW